MEELAKVRERMRPEVEAALDRSRSELDALDRRRRELEAEIERAAAWLGVDLPASEPDESGMTLHAAMAAILGEWGPTRATKLADEIEKRGLYRRKDGKPAGAHQVHARVHNYPDIFERVSPGVVGLR